MKCPICSVENNHPALYSYTPTTIDKLKLFDERSIVQCKSCGFGMIEKDVDPGILQNYYTSEYSGKAKKQVETKNTDNRTSYSTDIRSLSQLTLIRQYIDITSDSTIVEIGAGTGNFLFSLKQVKYKGKYIAFEPQEQAHECLRNLGSEIEKSIFNYQSAIKFKDSVDLLIMSHSLEHFNPGEIKDIVGAVKLMLKKNGIFFCEVPNANLELYPNAGERVVPHLSFFSIESLKVLLQNFEMNIEFINACGNKQLEKNTSQKIEELDKKGYFIFDVDQKNNILRNRKYHEDMAIESNRQKKRQLFLNVLFKLFGKKMVMSLLDFIRKCRQRPQTLMISDSQFSYAPSREFIRLIARK